MTIEPRFFRDVLSTYPTGVCVVTSQNDKNERYGLVVGSFTSISLDPPLVGFFPDKGSSTWPKIEKTGRFCVNVLGSHQPELCGQFSSKREDKFGEMKTVASPGGLPLLDDIVAWTECSINSVIEVGDHWFVVGKVEAMGASNDRNPLLFYRGGYHNVAALS